MDIDARDLASNTLVSSMVTDAWGHYVSTRSPARSAAEELTSRTRRLTNVRRPHSQLTGAYPVTWIKSGQSRRLSGRFASQVPRRIVTADIALKSVLVKLDDRDDRHLQAKSELVPVTDEPNADKTPARVQPQRLGHRHRA
jgi:hypothetical protein